MKFLLFFLLIITSCSVKIKNFEKYSKAPLLELENIPSKEQIKNSMPRVLITQAQTDSEEVKKSNAISLVAKDITTLLQTEKFANVIERKHNEITMQEIKIAELSGKGTVDTNAIDYILDVNVTNVTFSRQNITSARPVATPNGLEFESQDMYQYTSTVDGTVKIYKLPKMEIVETITLKGSYSENEKATAGGTVLETNNFALQSSNVISSKNYDSNITYKAIKSAVKDSEKLIKRFFKKTGYIIEKRSLKENYIFAINVGEQNGIKQQSAVAIVRASTTHNPLTDEDEEVKETICKGTIADKVFENRAWIVFEKSCQEKIRLGDKIEVIY